VTLTVGDAYTDAGATATDNKDGDLTANIETISNVDTTKAGTYRVTYNVSDAAENAATQTRTVTVKAEGNEEDPVTGSELISNAKANWKGSFSMLREYQGESYLLTGNEAYSYTYKPFATEAGSTYRVTATLLGADESRDENFAGSSILAIANAIPTSYKANEIAVSQSVGGSTPQEVTFTFTATGTTSYAVLRGDSAWKYPNLKTFSVKKVSGGTDTTPPVIILKGNSSVTLTVGDAYTDAGATATDNKDGDLTANIETISNVDTTKAGTYRVTYNVSDAAENAASAVSRTVIVKTVVIDSKIPWDHGNLKISSDNRMLQHEDGTGFFWMADTAWVLYRKTKEDIDLYIKNRAKKKFTVIQAVVMHYSGSSSNGESPFVERDLSLPNEKYWKHIDYMISKAAENNMYVALLPTWHSAVRYGDFKTTEDARKFGIWIAKRYKNRPNIIWMIGGDTPIDGSRVPEGMTAEEEVAIWNALGSAIDGVDTNHLITFHPLLKIPSVQLGRPEWLDFNLLQSGRGSTGNSVLHLQKALREGLAVVDGESLYEDLAYARKGESDRRTAFQVRDDAYSQLFAGAFGNTYGHDAIFRFWESEADPVCENWICTPRVTWREALDAPGGSQMQYVTELMQSRPLVGRVPDQSMISGSPAATEGKVATHGVGYGMVYLSLGGSVTVVMGKVSGAEVKAWWYNPRDGSVMEIAVFSNSGTQTFQAPDQQDWVLVLDDMSKGYGKPGE
jgi:5-hydroxyisourate hydrolase-like protein (transthyretin family)